MSDTCSKCHFKFRKTGECYCSDTGTSLHIIPDIEPHYNRGLGMMITSRSQYRQQLKEKGLVEVGNEGKYNSPEYNEKLQEQKTKRLYGGLAKEAHQMLEHYQGNYVWN